MIIFIMHNRKNTLALFVASLAIVTAGCSSLQSGQRKESRLVEIKSSSSICPVHHSTLIETTEALDEANNGQYSFDYYDARAAQFPLAMNAVHDHGNSGWWHGYYCPDCRSALKTWNEGIRVPAKS
jgi:hypothetical protein